MILKARDPGRDKKALKIKEKPFGATRDGRKVTQYEISNISGMQIRILDYGATITHILAPDRDGNIEDVVLGHDDVTDYEENNPYFGCVVGRYANRIANGKFILNGEVHELAQNNGPNTLHGGAEGFDKKVWKAVKFVNGESAGLILSYTSKDGEEGFPGNLECKLIVSLNNENEIHMEYDAATDAPTVINLCNHTYFNLKDGGRSPILDHVLYLRASRYTPVNDVLIPTGELQSVEGTPFDFRNPGAIGYRINEDNGQLKTGNGYDHNFVLDKKHDELSLAASVYEQSSGRILEVLTTEPGIQVYTGNFLDNISGKNDIVYRQRSGLALETQHFPDSPN